MAVIAGHLALHQEPCSNFDSDPSSSKLVREIAGVSDPEPLLVKPARVRLYHDLINEPHHQERAPTGLSVALRLQPFSPMELASFPLTPNAAGVEQRSGDAALGAIVSFKISAVGPEGHTVMSRNTASEALSKAIELVAAGFSNVRIVDRTGRLHAPEAFDRFFVKRGEAKAVRTQLQMT